jgi:hypothetical protein
MRPDRHGGHHASPRPASSGREGGAEAVVAGAHLAVRCAGQPDGGRAALVPHRTRQNAGVRDASALPPYVTWLCTADATRPLSHRSARPLRSPATVVATRSW